MVRSIRGGPKISLAAGFVRRKCVPRDDWKYDEEMWDGEEGGEEKTPPDKQCLRCSHWVPYDSPYCSWCGKVFEDRHRR
jgi:hypothetical protein